MEDLSSSTNKEIFQNVLIYIQQTVMFFFHGFYFAECLDPRDNYAFVETKPTDERLNALTDTFVAVVGNVLFYTIDCAQKVDDSFKTSKIFNAEIVAKGIETTKQLQIMKGETCSENSYLINGGPFAIKAGKSILRADYVPESAKYKINIQSPQPDGNRGEIMLQTKDQSFLNRLDMCTRPLHEFKQPLKDLNHHCLVRPAGLKKREFGLKFSQSSHSLRPVHPRVTSLVPNGCGRTVRCDKAMGR